MTQPDHTLTGEQVRALVDRYASGPLAEAYGHLDGVAEPALTEVPVLTKDDFRAALPGTMARARDARFGSLVYASGGTTASPKLSLIPSHMFVPDVAAHWNPLTADDVLLNYDTPGLLSSAHNFFNGLAEFTGAVSVPLGAVDDERVPAWLDTVESLGVTAFNGTQSQIAQLVRLCAAAGRKPPAFRKVLWNGEAFSASAASLVREQLPDTELHGIYGSTETWVIGHNGPGCDLDTFHVLPYQHIELDEGMILVTNTHPDCLNPVLRYRIGDRGTWVDCPCGRPGPALKVHGRDDPQLKFLSILVTPQEVAEAAHAVPAVTGVQVVMVDHGAAEERMELLVTLAPGTDTDGAVAEVRHRVLTDVYRLGFEVAAVPQAFEVRAVERLWVNPRSNKTPLLRHRSGSDTEETWNGNG
ncbi:phenylacetate--CoA ligase family protein [Streptomyces sp. NPDC056632]|uniref:phenylacetate--CoA ligase family protein n=1 Tax=Streptomyces sp. NPDC056632 TaxID=3345884 RepID=UPI00369079C3